MKRIYHRPEVEVIITEASQPIAASVQVDNTPRPYTSADVKATGTSNPVQWDNWDNE